MMEKISEFRKKLKWLDPFTYVDLFILPKVHALSKNMQNIVFVATFLLLVLLVSTIIGVVPFFLALITLFYAWLFFFEKNEAVDWGIYLLSAFVFAWAIYSVFGLALGTQSPFVIVMSASMEPLYHRGDVIILQGASFDSITAPETTLQQPLSQTPFDSFAKPNSSNGSNGRLIESIEFNTGETIQITQNGSIIVYNSQNINSASGPIIHRVVSKISASDGKFFLTKGDSINNNTIDQDCGRIIYGVPENEGCIMLYPVKESEIDGKALFQIPAIGCVKLWLFDNLASLISTRELPGHFSGIC
jgi:signal peptidase I